MPVTWLNGGRWMDDLPAVPAARWWDKPDNVRGMTADRWRQGIETYGADYWDVHHLGPIPGTPGCVVPQKFIEELRIADLFDHRGMRRK